MDVRWRPVLSLYKDSMDGAIKSASATQWDSCVITYVMCLNRGDVGIAAVAAADVGIQLDKARCRPPSSPNLQS